MATKQKVLQKVKRVSRRAVRDGWAKAFARMAAVKDAAWVYGPVGAGTQFESAEWQWSADRSRRKA